MSRRFALSACLLVCACFNPDDPAAQTDPGSSSGSSGDTPTTSPGSSTDGPTSTTRDTEDPTVADTSTGEPSSTTGDDVPDWGEGDPPDFGDLGDAGEGNLLVVHALGLDEAVDVWLVGDADPVATGLERGDAVRLEGLTRDARRVVLARAGTLDAVACSEWFPLRADEQWATVATRGVHDCTSQDDGVTPTFEQTLALSGNPVRFVHGGRPDALSIERGGVPEPGMLQPGETLEGTALPDCESSGCTVGYAVSSMGIGAPRYYTFATVEVADVPPPGELMMVIVGDVRQDWPAEPDAVAALTVTIDGDVRMLRRDPEVAFTAPEATASVDFLIPTPPSTSVIATSPPCFQGDVCAMATQRFRPGQQTFYANGPSGNTDGDFTLDGGERYVLVYTPGGDVMMLRDTFGRSDDAVSIGRVVNWTSNTLTIGRVFNAMGQAFENFIDVPAGTLSEENEVPDGDWDLVSATGGGGLGAGCFKPTDTPAPWRGFFWADGQLELDSWPPSQRPLTTLCF